MKKYEAQKIIQNQDEIINEQNKVITAQKDVIGKLLKLNRKILREWKTSTTIWLILYLLFIVVNLYLFLNG